MTHSTRLRRVLFVTACMVFLCGLVTAQTEEKPVVNTLASSKFASLPVLPACMTFAVERGDPNKGPSTLLLKFKSGCVVPWHWHTANEQLMFVSGAGKAEMKGSPPQTLKSGDYVLLPSKHVHQFTCITSCLVFDVIDGAFDIHYVDKDGKEIPPVQVLKTPAKAKPAKK